MEHRQQLNRDMECSKIKKMKKASGILKQSLQMAEIDKKP